MEPFPEVEFVETIGREILPMVRHIIENVRGLSVIRYPQPEGESESTASYGVISRVELSLNLLLWRLRWRQDVMLVWFQRTPIDNGWLMNVLVTRYVLPIMPFILETVKDFYREQGIKGVIALQVEGNPKTIVVGIE